MNTKKNTHLEALKERTITPKVRDNANVEAGRKLKFARKVLKISQIELGKVLGVEQSALSRIESGDQELVLSQVRILDHVVSLSQEYMEHDMGKSDMDRVERYHRIIFGE